jgi:hypothetical protein
MTPPDVPHQATAFAHRSDIGGEVAIDGEVVTEGRSPVAGAAKAEYTSAAMGPVETLALKPNGTTEITVLGQTYSGNSVDANVSVGDYVIAASQENGELSLLMPIPESYVPGSSTVWVAGTIAAVEGDVGQFSVGTASFDYTALLSQDPSLTPEVGDVIDAYGVQPAVGGSVLLGIHGSGVTRGIHGSGVTQGIHGSGVTQGIHGSGLTRGIHGSGVTQGIHGSGVTRGIHAAA